MRFLHTSDWHLGQKLLNFDRDEEHALALHWLAGIVREQAIDMLLVSGDIFDIGNPPNYARKRYYSFLAELIGSPCRHVVITAGNHDSPPMLDAPRELLEALNIHVISAVPENLSDEVLLLNGPDGQPEVLVAAVPFLRDRDLRQSEAGESGYDRIASVSEGMKAHFNAIADLAAPYRSLDIPFIAMGHLYAAGATAADPQNNIYIGHVENMAAGDFPDSFDYVALGHLHRAQQVGKKRLVYYSGSLIPLSFNEMADDKSVFVVETQGRNIQSVSPVAVPTFRRLKTIEGDVEEVKATLTKFHAKERKGLRPWVELVVHTDKLIPQLDLQLYAFAKEMPLEILKIKLHRQYQSLDAQLADEPADLSEIEVLDVFRRKCESFGAPPDEMEELTQTFLELQTWMQERSQQQD